MISINSESCWLRENPYGKDRWIYLLNEGINRYHIGFLLPNKKERNELYSKRLLFLCFQLDINFKVELQFISVLFIG